MTRLCMRDSGLTGGPAGDEKTYSSIPEPLLKVADAGGVHALIAAADA